MRQRLDRPPLHQPAMPTSRNEQLLALAAQMDRQPPRRARTRSRTASMRAMSGTHTPVNSWPMQPAPWPCRIAPVGLDPLARPLRDQRRGDHRAGMPECRDLALASTVGPPQPPMQLAIASGQLADQPLHRRRRTGDLADKPHIAAASTIGNRDRIATFDTSKATKASLYSPMVRPPCMRLGSACPSNPRFSFARKGRAAASPRGHDV